MNTVWTKEQEQAIVLRDRNILVSAAAGSGKTAVLVERILSRVTEPERQIDLDRLLIVTFTRAAAAEMRTRIGQALEERLAADPENDHLQRQSILLHHAQICTIHSFCTYVIQNYFHRIDLDPGYRIASEGELQMLRGEVIEELMEEEYERAKNGEGPSFLALVEALSPGRSDKAIGETIIQIANYAISDPDPEAWFNASEQLVAPTTEKELTESGWVRSLVEDVRRRLTGLRAATEKNISRATLPGGPAAYVAALESDIKQIDKLAACEDYEALRAAFGELSFAKLSPKKHEGETEQQREQVKGARNAVKNVLEALRKDYFRNTIAEVLKQLALARPLTGELLRLVRLFLERFREEKRERGICDFSDLEHNALAILLEKTEDGWKRTDAARELSEQYEEIMIDEYQDSNALQEIILKAVSREEEGNGNRFMVGDIKQSIYGFRQARPELFLDKYSSYATTGEKIVTNGQRIDLSKNFRSRREVLDIANAVFEKLMTEELGGLEYDEAARLHVGAAYPEVPDGMSAEAELLLVEDPSFEFLADDRRDAMEQTEALVVASRIRALVQSGQIYDKKVNGYRPVRYRDCVVLLRASSDTYVRILQEAGVPAHAESKEGYFSAIEVTTILNVLRICDNPRQDIPLAAVLRSPIVGMTDTELAELRCAYPEIPLWEAVCAYAERNEKLRAFTERLEDFRTIAERVPVHELIQHILDVTGYGLIAAAMPAGEQRQANLKMLIERAVEFENTSYHGLFSFLRYTEDLKKYAVDFGEVNVFGEGEDTVRVMTIHKSKGLEFPIVFVSNLGRGFNLRDSRRPIAMHARRGMALDAVDLESRVRCATLPEIVMRREIMRDNLAEEMRVLYVAMTRAKEKLILTGCVKDYEKEMAAASCGVDQERLIGATGFLDWILPAIAGCAPIRVEKVDQKELYSANRTEGERRSALREVVEDGQAPENEEIRALLARQAEFRYPYKYLEEMPAKVTVTELKRASLAALAEETGRELFEERAVVPYIPRFLRDEEEVQGAARGTIYHRVWESLDYGMAPTQAGVKEQLEAMKETGKISDNELAAVKAEDILTFLLSPLGGRMRAAAARGELWREQPFVFLVPAREVNEKYPEKEEILVQGVIDVFFRENGKYILVDYKTDRVQTEDGSDLIRKYSVQLSLYRRALEQITETPVEETFIYSLALGKEIRDDQ